jgi:hypothetical protein
MKQPPTRKSRISVADAVDKVRKTHAKSGNGRKTIAQQVCDAAGEELHIINAMMCDESVSHAFIWRVMKAMGINCSYVHVIQTVRPWFVKNYGWYYDIANADDNSGVNNPMPHHIQVDLA